MKIFINFKNQITELTNNSTFIETKGEVLVNEKYLKGNDFCNYISEAKENENLRGNYCFIKLSENKIVVSVDHIRSYPLFYAINNDILVISDKAKWILKYFSQNEFDNSAKYELWLSGYVLGNRTLYKNIKQLLPGEVISFYEDDEQIKLISKRFFEYSYIKNKKKPLEQLIKEHKVVMSRAILRLIKSANGRTIVLPLSGGLDSRLIALELRLQNYKNVICFSYGTSNNSQAIKSRATAKKLNYKWVFVKYDRVLWHNLYKSKEFNDYFYSADNLCSLPHIQDWPSIKYLIDKKLIPKDSIIVPGHTGDFLATGHIPPNFENVCCVEQFVDEIIIKHFRVNNFKKLSHYHQKKIKEKIQFYLPEGKITNSEEARECFQFFDWQERQSKFIVNSLRVYDYFNLEWNVPFWDIGLVSFWRKIPFDLKANKYLYRKYLVEINKYNVFDDIVNIKKSSKEVSKTPLKSIYKKIKSFLIGIQTVFKKRFLFYYTHEFQWYGMFCYWKIISSKKKIQNINTFLVDDYLTNIENENTLHH